VALPVAIVGETPVTAALAKLLGEGTDLSLALAVGRTTADHVEQAVGKGGAAILDLPAGESREFVRALGARNLRVVDLGPDLRVHQIPCAFDESHALGKRVAALPSAAAMAAFVAAGALIDKNLLHGDRLAIYAIGGGGSFHLGGPAASRASLDWRRGAAGTGSTKRLSGQTGQSKTLVALESAASEVATELGWIFEQRGAPPQRRVGVRVRGGEGMLALVQGELGSEEAQNENVLRAALAFGPDWVRVCAPGSEPDAARVAGTGLAEVSVAVDWFAEWILASCAIDPVFFPAHAALRALRQPA
jgi:N-acetyl-gamma-glutamylphosphate reductase